MPEEDLVLAVALGRGQIGKQEGAAEEVDLVATRGERAGEGPVVGDGVAHRVGEADAHAIKSDGPWHLAFPFFLLGHDRSGTTMLRLILDRGDVAIPSESMYLIDADVRKPAEDVLGDIWAHPRVALWGLEGAPPQVPAGLERADAYRFAFTAPLRRRTPSTRARRAGATRRRRTSATSTGSRRSGPTRASSSSSATAATSRSR